jgi:hypothetical protein
MTSLRRRIVVELPADDPVVGAVVVAAALSLFDESAEIALCLSGVEVPTEGQALELSDLCAGLLPPNARMADVLVQGVREALDQPHHLHVTAGHGSLSDAHAVILLSALADLTHGDDGTTVEREPVPSDELHRLRQVVRDRAQQRDAWRRSEGGVPVIVAVAQVQGTWGALDPVCRALAARDDVRLEVLALGSAAEQRDEAVGDVLRRHGYQPRDLDWFTAAVEDDPAVALVLFDNQYDALRPEAVRSTTLAAHGIRTALVPYGNNVGAGEQMQAMQYDGALHRLAWRVFARSQTQREMFTRYCAAGADHVRVLGLPKIDRVLAADTPAADTPAADVVRQAAGRPVVLWNPHFSLGVGGWSTFDRYLVPLTEYFAAHPEALLVVRPHFRLAHDAAEVGGSLQAMMSYLADAARLHENIVLDTASDYLATFAASDALISDLSSLITEFMPTGKPVLYLHRSDSPGVNEDAEYVFSLDIATSWPGVEAFLDDVVAGIDRGAERRRLSLERHFTHLDGQSGQRIADELVSGLLTEASEAVPGGVVAEPTGVGG